MKLFTVMAAALTLISLGAQARDLGLDEAVKLRDAGSIQAFEKLNQTALAQHPGGVLQDTELENQWGRYVYQLEVDDAQGVEWDIELDAATGEILKNHRDD